MSGDNKLSPAMTMSAVGAAAIAAISAYWIASASSKSRSQENSGDDLQMVLDKLEEMQQRLNDIESTKKKQKKAGSRSYLPASTSKQNNKGKNTHRTSDKSNTNPNNTKRKSNDDTIDDDDDDAITPINIIEDRRYSECETDANVIPPHLLDTASTPSSQKTPKDHHHHHGIGIINHGTPLPKTIVTQPNDRTSKFLMNRLDSCETSHMSSAKHNAPLANNDGAMGCGTGGDSIASPGLNNRDPVPIVLISDPGQDLDDEMMFIMARHLNSLDLISLQGVIANLSPSFARARLTRGTLDLLGLHRVPVGIGTDGGDVAGKHSSDQFETTARSYIVQEDGEAARGLESGHRLLQRLYDAAPDIEYVDVTTLNEDDGEEIGSNIMNEEGEDEPSSNEDGNGMSQLGISSRAVTGNVKLPPKKVVKGGLTIVITSSMKDIAIFVRDNPSLFASKTREVVVMGGCKPVPIEDSKTMLAMASSDAASIGSGGVGQYSASNIWSNLATMECEPDSAHNNTFDPAASEFFYSQCQKMNITLTVVSRYAAYAAKMPRSVYDDLALTGSSIGWRLRNSQRASIDQLWQRACSPDPAVRKGLPPRCDRKWFINTFCGGEDDSSRCCADTAWDLVTGFMQYDTIALLAAVPAIREKYFAPFVMPPLQLHRKEMDSFDVGLEHLRIEEGKILDMSEVTKEEGDEAPLNRTLRRRSSTGMGSEDGDNGATKRPSVRRQSFPASGPRAIQRAIARAKEDNKQVETPFEPAGLTIPAPFDRGTRNLIGISDKEHNLKDSGLLVHLLKTGYREGILCNHHTQPHIILHLQLRWDNLADTLLTCLMLRSLWDMRLASVLGVIISISPSDSDQAKRPPDGVSVSDVEDEDGKHGLDAGDKHRPSDLTTEGTEDEDDSNEDKEEKSHPGDSPSTLRSLAESIRGTLQSIGLAHVKFLTVSGKNMKEHKKQSSEAFLQLYESAPPIGVTLVLTSTFTSVWPFAESHPDLFRNKTVRVVHTGGALIWPAKWGWAVSNNDNEDGILGLDGDGVTSEQILVPDPAAQNHRLDMSSASLFYKRAQALSVPMVILSRHVAKECCIPRNFFDVLGSHGGAVGRRIYENERNSLLNLWKCSCAPAGSAARGNLPERCDAQWFAENFCAGTIAESEEEVWHSVEAVNLYR